MPSSPRRRRSVVSATRPVSDRNTSSSVGRRRPRSSTPMPASSRRRTASTIVPLRPRTGQPHGRRPRRPAARRTSAPARGSRRPCRRPSDSRTSRRSPPTRSLSSSGVPSAMTRAVVDDRDAIGEAVGLVEVLRRQQHGRAVGDERLDGLPQRQARRADPGPSSARRGTAPAAWRRARRRGPAAAACRRSTSSPGRSAASSSSKRSSSSRPRFLRRGARHAVQAPDHDEVLQAGEVLVDRGVLAREADLVAQLRRVGDDVEAGDLGAAGVGPQQRREDPHDRRLAGAVGAEQAEHRARRGLEVDAVERADVAEGLRQPAHADGRRAPGGAPIGCCR